MTLNQKKTKIHYQRLLPDELLILWGCWSGSHECVKYTLAYFVLLPPNSVCFHLELKGLYTLVDAFWFIG